MKIVRNRMIHSTSSSPRTLHYFQMMIRIAKFSLRALMIMIVEQFRFLNIDFRLV